MNKNIIKLFAILVMCFMIGAVLVACGAEPVQGEKGDKGDPGAPGAPGVPGGDICENGAHTWDDEIIWVQDHYYDPATGEESAGSYLRACVDCGFAQFHKGEHHFDEGVVVNPTCTEIGGLKKTCSDCGYVKIDDVKDALGHTIAVAWDAENIDASWVARAKDANVCALLQDTVYDTLCTVCGEIADTKTVEKVGHKAAVAFDKDNIDASWIARAKDANECALTQDTIYDSFCPVCNGVAATEIVTAPGHQVETAWNANDIPACWTADSKVNAICDCLEPTVYRADCVECGETVFEETVAAVQHVYDYYICVMCGYVTFDEPASMDCPDCDGADKNISHSYRPSINKSDSPTCLVVPTALAPCYYCNNGANDCGCPMDEVVTGEMPGHTWGDWYFVDGVKPTTTSGATARRECTVCKAEGKLDFAEKTEKFGNVEEIELKPLNKETAAADGYTYKRTQESDCIHAEIGTFTYATDTNDLVISGVVVDEKGGHNIDDAEYTWTNKPTINAGGNGVAVCTICGADVEFTTPALSAFAKNTELDDNKDKYCEEVVADYSYTVSRDDADVEGSFEVVVRDSAYFTHIPETAHTQYEYSERVDETDGKTYKSKCYWCNQCGHWIVVDTWVVE